MNAITNWFKKNFTSDGSEYGLWFDPETKNLLIVKNADWNRNSFYSWKPLEDIPQGVVKAVAIKAKEIGLDFSKETPNILCFNRDLADFMKQEIEVVKTKEAQKMMSQSRTALDELIKN